MTTRWAFVLGLLLLAPSVRADLTGGKSDSESGGFAAIVDQLSAAIAKRDATAAAALFTTQGWSRQTDPGRSLYEQAERKHFALRLFAVERRDNRAVVSTDILAGEQRKLVDRVFLYITRSGSRWLVEGVDENKGHVRAYLDGSVDATFSVVGLPSSPALVEIGGLIARAAKGEVAARTKLDAVLGGDVSATLQRLGETHSVNFERAYVAEKLGRACLDFRGSEPAFLYLERRDGRWTLTTFSYGSSPSERTFLR